MPEANTRLESPKTPGIRAKASGENRYSRRRFRHLFCPKGGVNFGERVTDELWPWQWFEYPGKIKLFGWLCGVTNKGSGKTYLYAKTLPAVRYRVISSKLRVIASRLLALADEADGLADERERVAPAIRFQKKKARGSGVEPPVPE